jgi:uncharacterized RDD family membrane protein YckC
MAPSSPPAGTSTLLTIGDIVTIGLQLYRRHAREYLTIIAAAALWVVLPLLASIVLVIVAASIESPGLGILAIIAGIVLFLWGMARYLAAAGAICRRSYYYLTHQDESVEDTQRYVKGRMWGFWRIAMVQGLLLMAVVVGLYIVLTIGVVIIFMGIGGVEMLQPGGAINPATAAIVGLVFLLVSLALIVIGVYGMYWFIIRFILAEVGYAVDSTMPAMTSLGRSWSLTTRNARRVGSGVAMVILISLPIQVLAQVTSGLATAVVLVLLPDDSSPAYASVTFLLSYAMGILLGLVLLPLWQSVKAVMFYDLVERRDGRSLDLGDRSPHPSPRQWLNQATMVTPESVELHFTLAGIGNRSWALLWDYVFLFGGLLLFWLAVAFTFELIISAVEFIGIGAEAAGLWGLAIMLLITFFLYTGYFVIFETLQQGRTPGKRILHLRVVQDNGQPVTLSQALLRSLLRPVDDLLFIGAFFIALGRREKRLGDWVAGTQVIQEPYADKTLTLTISRAAQDLAQHTLGHAEVYRLSPDQFVTLRDYLQRRPLMDATTQKERGLQLARQAKELIRLDTVPSGVSADEFLEALYLAYQQQPGRDRS